MKPFERQSIYINRLEEAFQSIEKEKNCGTLSTITPNEQCVEVPKVPPVEEKYKKLLIENKTLKKLLSQSKSVIMQKEMKIKKTPVTIAQIRHSKSVRTIRKKIFHRTNERAALYTK